MNGVVGEFKSFLLKSNMLALATAVVIGTAVNKVVTGVVDDLLMPVIGLFTPSNDSWRNWQIVLRGDNAIKIGDLLGRVVDFVIIAAVVFLITKALIPKEVKAPTKSCNYCKETVPLDATKCRACTSTLS